jgi:hypothetical protein
MGWFRLIDKCNLLLLIVMSEIFFAQTSNKLSNITKIDMQLQFSFFSFPKFQNLL